MNRIRVSQRVLAALLSLTVWNLCTVATFASEIAPLTAAANEQVLSNLMSVTQPGRHSLSPSVAALQPKGVTGSIGDVFWTNVAGGAVPFWNCSTAAGSSVSLNLAAAGKISLGEASNINLQLRDRELLVTLLRGSVYLEVPAGNRTRLQTFKGVYLLGPDTGHKVRFTWRDAQVAIDGATGLIPESATKIDDQGLRIAAAGEPVTLAAGRPGLVSVLVSDAAGRPIAGVPVRFSGSPAAGSGRVAFAGASGSTALTNERGVAQVAATFVGSKGAEVAVMAAIEGTEIAAAVPAAVAASPNPDKKKWLAIIALLGVAGLTAGLVARSVNDDDPKLVPGAPTRVAP